MNRSRSSPEGFLRVFVGRVLCGTRPAPVTAVRLWAQGVMYGSKRAAIYVATEELVVCDAECTVCVQSPAATWPFSHRDVCCVCVWMMQTSVPLHV